MGRHSTIELSRDPNVMVAGRPLWRTIAAFVGPMKSRRNLPIWAFVAAFAIIIVMVVDPYSGEYADAAEAPSHWSQTGTQHFVMHGTFAINVARDAFGSVPGHHNQTLSTASGSGSAPTAGIPSPGSAQAIAKGILADKGMGNDQYSCLVSLWNRESHWSVTAANPNGAYGIPQALPGSKMASAGPDWRTNARTQILWGLGYISSRYGTPCGAWAHSQATGWY
ncbi:MAG TPA: lytic transglycosylase domain-containing protein [Galbitalea sp.]